VVCGVLSENDIFVLKELIETLEHLDEKIKQVEARIEQVVNAEEVYIVASIWC